MQLFTEAALISIMGGIVGLIGSIALLRGLSSWEPVSRFQGFFVRVNPDANVYVVALLLVIVSGFLFGAVPVSQVFLHGPRIRS